MDSKPELTAEQLERIAKLTEMGGEVLFEASAGYSFHARGAMRLLAHILGQLYGETIRQTRGYDGLQEEVTTTFMCGMALEPNFGREEEPDIEAKAGADGLTHWHVKTSARAGTKAMSAMDTALREGTLGEAKSLGQLLYEGQPHGAASRPWAKLSDNSRRAFEKEAVIRAEAKEKAAMEAILDAPVGAPLPKDSPFATIDWDKGGEVQAKKCWKCHGSGDMGFTTRVPCDAC